MRNENLTLQDINNLWRESMLTDDYCISQKQMQRDREAILELFGIDIQPRRVDQGVYCYFVANREHVKEDYVLRWTINTLAVAETLSGYSMLRDRICFEDFAPDLYLLPVILQAMKDNRLIAVKYKRFEKTEARIHSVQPFFLKSYEHRIYLIALIEGKSIPCVLALDRILSITPQEKRFRMQEDFSVEEFFEHCYGVYHAENMKPETVILRAYGDEMFYLDTRPLHHSQATIGFLDLSFGCCDFQLFLKPTNDLIGFLLSRAERIEVLEPLWLRKKLKGALDRSLKLYAKMESESVLAV